MPRKRSIAESKEQPPSKSSKLTTEEQPGHRRSPSIFKPYPISKVNRLIEPGPVLLVTTGSLAEKSHNVMTIGFHMMLQHESPTLIAASIGPWDHSYKSLKSNRECVLAIPSAQMATTVVDIGNCSGTDVDKWDAFGLTATPAKEIQAPLVGNQDILANVECVVEDTKLVGRYDLWVLKVVAAWVNPECMDQGGKMFHHCGDGTFTIAGEKLDLRERMVKWKELQD